MPTLQSFEDLDCYKACRQFRIEVSLLCRTLPKVEERRLIDQLLRSARSVTANIAEGFGRHHHQENIQYCRQARGSLTESLEHLNVAHDESFITTDSYNALRQQQQSCMKILNGYIAYLQRASRSK